MARGFASDNSATVHPAVLEAIARQNTGHAFSYGHDPYTQQVEAMVADAFGVPAARTFFVFNGTGANVLSLRALCRPWEAVICSENAHLHTDEVGAPEAIAGAKLLIAPAHDGRMVLAAIERFVAAPVEEHFVTPRVISITQSTELGTLYSLDELREITELAHAHGLIVHMDGSRLSNAAAALGVGLGDVTAGVGVDVVSFGGTKNGLMIGEAVVVFDPALTEGMLHLRKQTLQLASKMRFVAAQFDALLTDELWRANAARANAMATRLAEAVKDIPGVTVTRPVQVNAVFAILPASAREQLLQQFDFYAWDESTGEVRWMCSWDTTEDDVDRFAEALRSLQSE
jgi:threonine aldolase